MLGDDPFGAELRRNLEAEGVDVGRVGTAATATTGMALIVVQGDGENTITLSPGANAVLTAADVGGTADSGGSAGSADSADSAGFSDSADPADVLLMNLEVPFEAVLAAARGTRALRVLNAAPIPDQDISELLRVVDVLVVNETEAAALLGREVRDPRELLPLGPRTAVLTLGAGGATAATAEGTWSTDAFAVEVVDAVGAGDAFCAALAVGLGSGAGIETALRRACAAGALATTRAAPNRRCPRGPRSISS
ncbi:PfkB family carbohydrate kinase [Catenulispora yoronensis]